jgi:hypothetical protein
VGLEPKTYRDPFISLYQSAVEDVVRARAAASTAGSTAGGASGVTTGAPAGSAALGDRPGLENSLVRAAAQIGALKMQNGDAPIPDTAPPTVTQTAWTCAKLGYELLEARVKGDAAQADELENDLKYNKCDLDWGETIASYVKYFGPDGKGAVIPYIRPGTVGAKVLALRPGATVALIGDWGTGTSVAVNLLQEVAVQKPDVLIHLGDIYYSGTAAECSANFQNIVDQVLDRARTGVPVYTLSGNHDMYSGGAGYYGLLQSLNPPELRQPASFFCLRCTDNSWQFIGMDTGLHDYNPFTAATVLTYLEQDEEDWIDARIQEFPGKTILLSHHQLFSAFTQIGPPNADGSLTAFNPKLLDSYRRFMLSAPGRIAAWYWGHEHNLCVYAPCVDPAAGLALDKGRCVGCGAVPVFTEVAPYTVLTRIANPPQMLKVELEADDQVFTHGFAILRLAADGSAKAEYYQDTDGTTPIFTEAL